MDNSPKDVEIFVDLYADLVVRINELLRENNFTRKELAEKLEKKPSEISKWLNGEHNFTLRSLAKLSAELGEPLLEVPKRKPQITFNTSYSHCVQTFVDHKKTEETSPTFDGEWKIANEIDLLSNVG